GAVIQDNIFCRNPRKLVNENLFIVVEDLAVKNQVINHYLAKAISDCGGFGFMRMLNYKQLALLSVEAAKDKLEVARLLRDCRPGVRRSYPTRQLWWWVVYLLGCNRS
ncbi:MAG: hypothetical protein ACRC62_34165, partial [Microcoleus sp.]